MDISAYFKSLIAKKYVCEKKIIKLCILAKLIEQYKKINKQKILDELDEAAESGNDYNAYKIYYRSYIEIDDIKLYEFLF